MIRETLPALLVLLAALPASAQTTWWVDDATCPDAGAGTPSEPFCSIQDAIDSAVSGDTVRVRPGVYLEDLSFRGEEIVVVSEGGPQSTWIRGTGGGGSLVTFENGEGLGTVFEGFFLGTDFGNTSGRGILVDGASPTIRGNVIQNMWASAVGGGILCTNGAAPAILDNRILRNASIPGIGVGGGIACQSSSPWIRGNRIDGNYAFGDPGCRGGGLYLSNSSPLVESNLIVNNDCCDTIGNTGGGIYITGGAPTLVGNTLSGNFTCDGPGGGLYVTGGSTTVQDTILWGNTAQTGGEIFLVGSTRLVLTHCDVDDSEGKIAGGGPPVFEGGNVSVDPQFVGGGDFHLRNSSPLRDAGSLQRAPGGLDADGEPRVLDGLRDGVARVDIGWDEYDWTTLTVDGQPSLGQTLVFRTRTWPSWSMHLVAFSRTTGDVPHPRWGALLLGGRIKVFGTASTFGTAFHQLTIPLDPVLLGETFHVQGACLLPGGAQGAFSRRLSLRVL